MEKKQRAEERESILREIHAYEALLKIMRARVLKYEGLIADARERLKELED